MMPSRVAIATIAAGLAAFALVLARIRGRAVQRRRAIPDEVVDETVMDSFPASDPPSYGAPTRVGRPAR